MEHRRGKLRAMSEFTLTEAWRFCATRRQQAIPVRSAASLECTVNPCNSAPSEERGCQSLRLETRKHKRRNSIRPRSNDHNLRGTDPRMELGLVRETAYVTSYVHVASGTGYFAQAKQLRKETRAARLDACLLNYERLHAGERRCIRSLFRPRLAFLAYSRASRFDFITTRLRCYRFKIIYGSCLF